jgi:hypothetical protein
LELVVIPFFLLSKPWRGGFLPLPRAPVKGDIMIYVCGEMREAIEDAIVAVRWTDNNSDKKWMLVHLTGEIEIFHCPFCGQRLEANCFFY